MTATYTEDRPEIIVKYAGYVVLKGTYEEFYTSPQRNAGRTAGANRPRGQITYPGVTHEGVWVQHDHYKGQVIWRSWDHRSVDNKCFCDDSTLSDVDLAKLLCFAKAIK